MMEEKGAEIRFGVRVEAPGGAGLHGRGGGAAGPGAHRAAGPPAGGEALGGPGGDAAISAGVFFAGLGPARGGGRAVLPRGRAASDSV